MNELIERYIHDVIRRLPEKDRAEIERELRANIYDMLPENYLKKMWSECSKRWATPRPCGKIQGKSPIFISPPALTAMFIF